MFGSFLFISTSLAACVVADRVHPPLNVLELTLGVSKATYLPLKTRRFIQDGHIIENPSSTQKRNLFGFIPLPPKYNPTQDKKACSVGGWIAKAYENNEAEALMFTNPLQKLVVFGFRGTEPLNPVDWRRNFHVIPTRSTIDGTIFTTHKGFKDRYAFIASWFEREYTAVSRDYSIVLTGHSLGGAEATIAAVYAAGKLKRRPDAVVTYGSPLVGDQNFKNYYNEVVGCDRTLRVTVNGDFFPSVPKVFGYQHVCGERKLDAGVSDRPHDLYAGYEKGVNNMEQQNAINFGCDLGFN